MTDCRHIMVSTSADEETNFLMRVIVLRFDWRKRRLMKFFEINHTDLGLIKIEAFQFFKLPPLARSFEEGVVEGLVGLAKLGNETFIYVFVISRFGFYQLKSSTRKIKDFGRAVEIQKLLCLKGVKELFYEYNFYAFGSAGRLLKFSLRA